MSKYTLVATGSNTTVATGPGNVYGIHVAPVAGTSVVVVDSVSIGATPDLNSNVAGTILRTSVYPASPGPDFLDMKGAHFGDGLTVAATSTARLTVFTSQ